MRDSTSRQAHTLDDGLSTTLEVRPITKEHTASIFSKLYFQWLFPLLRLGHTQPLQLEQIWSVTPERRVGQHKEHFQKAYESRKHRSHKLLFALYDVLQRDFWIAALCQLVSGCIQVLAPFVLKYVIIEIQLAYTARMSGSQQPSVGRGIGLVVGLFLMQMVQSVCMSHFFYRAMLLGGEARSVLIACIFEKSMKLSNRARVDDEQSGWNDGSINNLMANHTSRIDNAAVSFHPCWMAPLQVAIALTLLCINLGYSALVGFAIICVLSPVFTKAVKILFARRVKVNEITEERVRLAQETLSSIKTVKIFAWEPKLLDRLSDIRGREIAVIAGLLRMKNAILVSTVTLPLLASMLTFITYYFANHVLDPAPIFSSLALFNVLTVPLQTVALSVGRVVDANASASLLTAFFDAEEREDGSTQDEKQAEAIVLKNASFTWEQSGSARQDDPSPSVDQLNKQDAVVQIRPVTPVVAAGGIESIPQSHTSPAASQTRPRNGCNDDSAFGLQDLNLSVARGELIVVIGPIGSGKSSLIAALSADMRMTSGTLAFGGSRALSAQSLWIQNTSIKENILLGSVLNEKRYNTVLDACALRPDLDLLPNGDDTEIGERGVTLSGGQKQRVNIARAIYANKDVVLLDDPLSAVDTHVGRHISDHAICGLLKEKCCILVSHHLYVLPRADRIVCMKDGNIAKLGTYEELCKDPHFANMVASSTSEHDNKGKSQGTVLSEPVSKEEIRVPSATALRTKVELMQVEERQKGSVSLEVYREFIAASGSIWNLGLVLATIAVTKAADITTSLWLSWWISRRYNLGVGIYIGTYVALCVWQAICDLIYCNTITDLCARSGKTLVDQAMSRTIGAPMSFFDTTPLGRITNLFSKDVDTIDNRLADNLRFLVWIIGTMIAVFALVTSFYYYFAIAIIPLAIVFVYATSYYRPAAREIKRHEAVLRSAVFARFLEGVIGASTLRAYGAEKRFAADIVRALDDMNGAYFLTFAGQRWLSVRLDALGNVLVLVIGILTITTRSDLPPSIAGLVLAYMLGIVQLFQEIVHTYADTQNDMNSVERLVFYARELEQEDKSGPKEKLPVDWPQVGAVTFNDVEMRYRPGLPLVLSGLNVSVRAGERVGIIGRTGAGKSSILTALMRLCELHRGQILIDNIDISTLRLHDLRRCISIIPQDPTLFNGTVRSNLDPFDELTDLQLWDALRAVGLLDRKGASALSLDSAVADGGTNLSHGQRQLLALARLHSTKSKIILCDEATSSVDAETDVLVQQTMLEMFAGRTMLCIAHRLSTVIGYDRILVMDAGKAAELDAPLTLYDRGGTFRSMCDRSGISRDAIVRARDHIPLSVGGSSVT